MIRSFDWRDFPNLHRNRNDGIWLDASLALTGWMALVPAGALLATFAPATGIFTYVATKEETNENEVVGQFLHTLGAPNAKLTFITPEDAMLSAGVPHLLDHLAVRAGERGAHNLLAEVNDRSPAYEVLRGAGYGVYARQRIWQLTKDETVENRLWRQVVESDEYHVHHLYHSLVPALVQQTEPPPWENMNGLAFTVDGEMLAYVHLSYGPKGILAQPFVHPDTDHAEELLRTLYDAIPHIRNKPVYLCVRSHQAWLAPFLDELGYSSGERQAVMVKRLVIPVKEPAPILVPAGLEAAQPKTTTYSPGLSGNGHHFRPGTGAAKNHETTKNHR